LPVLVVVCDSVLVVFPVLCFSILCFISSILASEPNYFDISCLQFLLKISANQRFLWPLAAMLDDESNNTWLAAYNDHS
jgi:hypothetical protein